MSSIPDPADPASRAPLPPLPRVYVKDAVVWEYKRICRNLAKEDAPGDAELNALGEDGWELTGMFKDSPFVYLYFKRLRE